MNNKNLKESFKAASNVMLVIVFILMLIAAWLDHYYIAIATTTLAVFSIAICLYGAEEFKIRGIAKDLNIFFFIVAIIVCIAVMINKDWLLYVGLAIFLLILLLYVIVVFSNTENSDNNQVNKSKSSKYKKAKKKK